MKKIEELYESLYFIRQLELKVAEVYPSDKIKSPVHLSIGQEFVSVALCQALRATDYVAATYRGHAAYLAKGGCPKKLIAEMYGKSSGCAKGRGGSMHLVGSEVNVIGTSAVVGTGVPVATGYALSQKLQQTDNVVVCFLGDGATEEGCFYESLNFSGLHQLPIVFVVENNHFAIHEPVEKRWADSNLQNRVQGFGVDIFKHKDGDVLSLFDLANTVVNQVRQQQKPALIEVDCYRWYQHVGPNTDFDQGYRSEQDAKWWLENDPLNILSQKISAEVIAQIHQQANERVEQAFKFAEQSAFPDVSELHDFVFATGGESELVESPSSATSDLLTYAQALNQGQDTALAIDDKTFLMGLDIDDHLGIQGTTKGLVDKYGAHRVFTTPLSEDAMTGVAIGAAMSGMKPIHIHIRMDFLLLCMNQLINIAAKAHYMYGAEVKVPLVVRCIIGKSWGQGAQHSQALHSLFMHIPGLKVVAPSNAYDAKGLLLAAVNDANPVLFMEHRLLFNTESDVPQIPYQVKIGKSKVVKQGKHLTIVAISNMVIESLRAAELLSKEGYEVTVIDPITLAPLDMQPVIQSVQQTEKLLVVDNGWLNCGASSEIVADVCEQIDKPIKVKRLGFAATTCPTTPSLEAGFYPNPVSIAQAALSLIDKSKALSWQPNPKDAELAYQKQFKGPF
ncbi:alpha-ketoacid dehydrogenase subunit alpha/beta [Thalassotalea sp. G2M2-11]|uniref:alpha-ketoacid dehydrogenase subunit alpha/beta n=1 Tax=Thalassotalea sp. G2M2-11 TaxID=2787627 RepID=UPI0019D26B12|nr:alpha-ketoacid dehydrogenase subunit alpha/beta [Thalassotalea sp. G2M2-11]